MSIKIAVIPGSFSPLHAGHLAIAEWADRKGYDVVFEVSRLRFDKEPYSDDELEKIKKQFSMINRKVVVTECISFVEKCIQFKNPAFRAIHNMHVIGPDIAFLIGYDTAERICDPKYYFGSTTERDRCLNLIKKHDVEFIVFERDGNSDISKLHNTFISMASVADGYKSIDISSTKIRQNSKRRIVSNEHIRLIYLKRGDRFVLPNNDELEYELCSHNTDNYTSTTRFGEEFVKINSSNIVRKVNYV